MTLKELKDWVNDLPEEFMSFTVVNGEYGVLEDEVYFRVDKPVTTISIDMETNEVLILNDSKDEINPEMVE